MKSLTLIELLVVITILTFLAAIAIPNLLRVHLNAQEAVAAIAMQTISTAQVQWRSEHSSYANLSELGGASPPYIDSALANGTKQGYTFSAAGIATNQFYATATPKDATKSRTYYIDEDGILCRSNTTNVSPPASHADRGCPSGFSEID